MLTFQLHNKMSPTGLLTLGRADIGTVRFAPKS